MIQNLLVMHLKVVVVVIAAVVACGLDSSTRDFPNTRDCLRKSVSKIISRWVSRIGTRGPPLRVPRVRGVPTETSTEGFVPNVIGSKYRESYASLGAG